MKFNSKVQIMAKGRNSNDFTRCQRKIKRWQKRCQTKAERLENKKAVREFFNN